MSRKTLFAGLAAFSLVAVALVAAPISQPAAQQAALVRGNAPGEWRYWAADAWGTRYSSAAQIDATNFDSLQVAWQWRNPDTTAMDEYFRTTPLYAKGRMFSLASTRRAAFGIDPATGATLWSWKLDEGIRWQKAPRQFAGRGLAYWTDGPNERVIVVTPGYHLASLDAKTGKPDPAFGKKGVVDLMDGLGYSLVPLAVDDSNPLRISENEPARRARRGETWNRVTKTGADGTVGIDPVNGQIGASSPAIIVGNVIIVGNSAMHGYYPLRLHNIQGTIRGFDVKTGKQLWKFNLIPQPGEFGAETWKNGSKVGTAGTGKNDAWAPYAADPELGLVYIPVGMPLSDEYGGHRPGDNLFGNSIVALDAKTGQRKWHFQMIHHDIWDYDTPMAPNVLDVVVNGRPRKVVAQTTKQGWVYVFDRVTGEPIWPMPETPVLQSDVPGEQTSPTQPIPTWPVRYALTGFTESDLIDYTPAIKDSALTLAKHCRMGPYYIPPVLEDGTGPSGLHCSWYHPGASGGVNIDGGAAVDPETGMIYIGGQSAGPTGGGSQIEVSHDPCSEHRYSQGGRDSCQWPGPVPKPADYKPRSDAPQAFAPRNPMIGGVSIFKPQGLGGISAYDLNSGDKKWWVPNGNRWREVTSTDAMFAGITLPRIPALGGQPEVITTRTLVIHGTGRQGGAGAGRGRGAPAAQPTGGRGGGGTPAARPQLFAFDKTTGNQVGAVAIPAVNSAVPMTFVHQGKQYIVFASGAGGSTALTALALPRK